MQTKKNCSAVVFVAPEKVEIQNIELPEIGPGEIGIKTLCSGISAGTELWLLKGSYSGVEFPTIPGYQKVGVVDCIGSGVENYNEGDMVFLRSTHLAPGTVCHWGGHTG